MVFIARCMHRPELVFAVDGVEYHASNQSNIDKFNGDLILNLTRLSDRPNSTNMPAKLKDHYEDMPEEIMILWPDFETPKVKLSFWSALFDYIEEKGYKKICIHCQQGHGRTGTALSAMLIANLGYPASESVEIVRRNHCEDAVESSEQSHYLQKVDKHYNKREPSEKTFPIPSMSSYLSSYNDYRDYTMGVEPKDKD